MKTVTLHFREMHMYKDVDVSPITHIDIKCNDDDCVDVPVIEGVAYAPVAKTNYVSVLAAIKETPEDLAKNPDVKLVYVDEKKKED